MQLNQDVYYSNLNVCGSTVTTYKKMVRNYISTGDELVELESIALVLLRFCSNVSFSSIFLRFNAS